MNVAPTFRDEPDTIIAPLYGAIACVKDWGRCGVILGANFGIILGAVFIAIPFSAEIPRVGLFGTLLVGAIACALMAGAFAGVAAALYSKASIPAFVRVRTGHHGTP